VEAYQGAFEFLPVLQVHHYKPNLQIYGW